MRRIWHPHLKEGLDYNEIDIDPKDLLEPLPDNHYDPAERAAKRRRVEAIATGYIRGQIPVLLSSRLRGPFDSAWRNPWAEVRSSTKEAAKVGQPSPQDGPTQTDSSGDFFPTGKAGHLPLGRRPQGKAAEAVAESHDDRNPEAGSISSKTESRGKRQTTRSTRPERTTIPPSTSICSESNECSVSTEYFTADGDQQLTRPVPAQKRQWLRRCESEERRDETDLPTPSRLSRREDHVQAGLNSGGPSPSQLVTATKASPQHAQCQQLDRQWTSSNSAPMDISSPIRPMRVDPIHSPSNLLSVEAAQEPGSPTTDVAQDVLPSSRPSLDNTTPRMPESEYPESSRSEKNLAQLAMDNARFSKSSSKGRRVTKAEVRRSAERCATVRNTRSSQKSKGVRKANDSELKATDTAHPPSSTSFMYRKIVKNRGAGSGPPKSKPRLMTFDSSPAIQNVETRHSSPPSESERTELTPMQANVGDEARSRSPRPDPYDDITGGLEGGEDATRINQESVQSTQTALILAQMNFQGSSVYSPASVDSPVWSEDRARLSPAIEGGTVNITPFRDLNAELDERLPYESAIRGPPMSTQDLFAAASPFAISTVKKRPAQPKKSGLRFAVFSNEPRDTCADGESGVKSPTPSAERIPLRERNSCISFKPVNGSQKSSQDSSLTSTLRAKKVELPQLDFRTSLDDELAFTGRFMNHLDQLG